MAQIRWKSFAQLPDVLLADKRIDAADKLLFAVLTKHQNIQGGDAASISLNTLASKVGKSRSAVIKGINRLVEHGLIVRVFVPERQPGGTGETTAYAMNIKHPLLAQSLEGVSPTTQPHSGVQATSPSSVRNTSPSSVDTTQIEVSIETDLEKDYRAIKTEDTTTVCSANGERPREHREDVTALQGAAPAKRTRARSDLDKQGMINAIAELVVKGVDLDTASPSWLWETLRDKGIAVNPQTQNFTGWLGKPKTGALIAMKVEELGGVQGQMSFPKKRGL